MSVPETLKKAGAIFEERTPIYGGNKALEDFGRILKSLFPKGLSLQTENDFGRAANIFMLARKLSRYTYNFEKGGHEDSVDDSIVYFAIQKELDNMNKEDRESGVLGRRGVNGTGSRAFEKERRNGGFGGLTDRRKAPGAKSHRKGA